MLWLYLHFPHLMLDHLRRHQETSRPLVIVAGAGQSVAQACPQARALGVAPGMRLKTALSLAPELGVVRSEPKQETRLLEEQARWLYRYVAHITLRPPDGILTEVGSLQTLYGGLGAVWQTVAQALAERQLNARLATGHTPGAARLLARAGTGVCTADRSAVMDALAALPLSAAEFDDTTCTRLQRLGLQTLGEVLALPAAELARRLSPETLAHIQKLQGTRADPQAPWQPPHRFRQQADFVQDIEQTQGLLFPLQRLLSELAHDLCWRQQDTDSLHLTLHHRHEEPTRLRIRTAGPEHRAEAFLDLIRLRLEQQPLRAPVTSLELAVRRFIAREAPTGQDLLGDGQDLNEAWHSLISRLQARLGSQALTQLAPQADHRPERAWSAMDVQQRPRPRADTSPLPRRPLWLLQKPQPLTEPPSLWLSGPERICSGWWDGQRVYRDYYIAQLSSGPLAWVYRDAREGWFLHGWFG